MYLADPGSILRTIRSDPKTKKQKYCIVSFIAVNIMWNEISYKLGLSFKRDSRRAGIVVKTVWRLAGLEVFREAGVLIKQIRV